jgi:hypothetical protein
LQRLELFPFFLFSDQNLRYHHGVIHDGANQTSHDLNCKRVSWGQMDILGKLEIAREKLAHLHSVEGKASEVEVGKGLPGEPKKIEVNIRWERAN